MKNKKNKLFLRFLEIIIVLTVLLLCWLNLGPFNTAKYKFLNFLHLPIGYVGGNFVSIKEFAHFISPEINGSNLNFALFKKENENLFFQKMALLSLQKKESKDNISLKIRFYKEKYQSSGVEKVYNLVNQGFKNGVSFSNLNQEYDQDPYSKAFYGDLGFLESTKILPEILKELDFMAPGDIEPIATRYGWHIIVLEDKDQKGEGGGQRFHLKQIFLPVPGFEEWLVKEIKKVKIIKFIYF